VVNLADKGTLKVMNIGDRVRVKESVVVYHHPEHRNEAFDIKGQEGEIITIVKEYEGRPVSANFPYLVKFAGKFRAHLQEFELEAI
jgi:Ferredoxin thioredoxin reductase variable alpha chain